MPSGPGPAAGAPDLLPHPSCCRAVRVMVDDLTARPRPRRAGLLGRAAPGLTALRRRLPTPRPRPVSPPCRPALRRASRPTKLDAYKPYLDQRWQEGCTSAWKLWEEINAQGYPDGYGNVCAYVSRNLRGKPQLVGPRLPSARAVTRWILTHPEALPESDRLQLKAVLANCPELDVLAGHVRTFAHMLTQLQGHQLPAWI
ncbi:hypothetical protein [Streptomyces sp. NPDC056410]|uniref:hypothetical protein n=1 Tax=Streptomyces sp. NPDC056410 TaxID=3345812 RepID=UPI0035E23C7C